MRSLNLNRFKNYSLKDLFTLLTNRRTRSEMSLKYYLSESVVPTRRDLEEYLYILGIKIDDLGETVLDLGAGMNEAFSKELSLHNKKVFSVNPKLVLPKIAEEAQSDYKGIPWQGKSVAALAQALPFADKSFDSIVAVESVPAYLPNTDHDYYLTFNEICRVLKPGGKCFINNCVYLSEKNIDRYVRIFKELNSRYKIKVSFPYLDEFFEETVDLEYMSKLFKGHTDDNKVGMNTEMVIEKLA